MNRRMTIPDRRNLLSLPITNVCFCCCCSCLLEGIFEVFVAVMIVIVVDGYAIAVTVDVILFIVAVLGDGSFLLLWIG